MPSRRKVSSSLAAGRRSNEPKADYPCDICTDSRTSNSIIKTKIIDSKYSQNFKGHLECIQLIEELSLVEMAGIKKVVINDRKDYRYRQQLKCNLCTEMHGAKIQCTLGKCVRAFHINCTQKSERTKFELKLEDEREPYKLNCGYHGGPSHHLKADLRSRAMKYLKPHDRVTIRFPNTGSTDMWIVSIDKDKQEVAVTSGLWESIAPENIWTVKWSAVLVDDLLRSYIPEITDSSKGGVKAQRTATNVIPTPPSGSSPEVQEVIMISDSPSSSSSQSVAELISSQPDEEIFEQDSSITPLTKFAIQSTEGSTFSLASVPGLLEVVVDYLFEDPSWEKRLSDLVLG